MFERIPGTALSLSLSLCVSMSLAEVADQILKLVPNQENFRRTLRFIKCPTGKS